MHSNASVKVKGNSKHHRASQFNNRNDNRSTTNSNVAKASTTQSRKWKATKELDMALERAEGLAAGASLSKLYAISNILQDESNSKFLKNWLPQKHGANRTTELDEVEEY